MMDSLRAATRNTMFDQWLEAVQGAGQGASAPAGADGPAASRSVSMGLDEQARVSEPLQEVAEYLAGGCVRRIKERCQTDRSHGELLSAPDFLLL